MYTHHTAKILLLLLAPTVPSVHAGGSWNPSTHTHTSTAPYFKPLHALVGGLLAFTSLLQPTQATYPQSSFTTFGGTAQDRGTATYWTEQGELVIAGDTFSYGGGNVDGTLTAVNTTTSTLTFSNAYGSTSSELFSGLIAAFNETAYFMRGYTKSYSFAGGADQFILKTDASGTFQCYGAFGTSGHEYSTTALIEQQKGHIVVSGGIVNATTGSGTDSSLFAIDEDCNFQWMRALSTDDTENILGMLTADNNIYLYGTFDNTTYTGSYLAKINHNATLFDWQILPITYNNNLITISRIAFSQEGHITIAGYGNYTHDGDTRSALTLAEYDKNTGALHWLRAYNVTSFILTAMPTFDTLSNGGYAITGYSTTLANNTIAYLITFNSTGHWQESATLSSGSGNVFGVTMAEIAENTYAIVGRTDVPGNTDIFYAFYTHGTTPSCWDSLAAYPQLPSTYTANATTISSHLALINLSGYSYGKGTSMITTSAPFTVGQQCYHESATPTSSPSNAPSIPPTQTPSNAPSTMPTNNPSINPTQYPTSNPSTGPTHSPITIPSTSLPIQNATSTTTSQPTKAPTSLIRALNDPTTDAPALTDRHFWFFDSDALLRIGNDLGWGTLVPPVVAAGIALCHTGTTLVLSGIAAYEARQM